MQTPEVLYCFPDCAGQKFQPSNGTEGMIFTEAFCERCIHEKFVHTGEYGDLQCEIFSNTMLYNVNDKEYPQEWQYNEKGWPVCTKWKYWDWGNGGDGLNEPPEPEPYNPNQLVLPFIFDEVKKPEMIEN